MTLQQRWVGLRHGRHADLLRHAATLLDVLHTLALEAHAVLAGAAQRYQDPAEASRATEAAGEKSLGVLAAPGLLGDEEGVALAVAEVVEDLSPQAAPHAHHLLQGLRLAPLLLQVGLLRHHHGFPAPTDGSAAALADPGAGGQTERLHVVERGDRDTVHLSLLRVVIVRVVVAAVVEVVVVAKRGRRPVVVFVLSVDAAAPAGLVVVVVVDAVSSARSLFAVA